MSLLVIFFFFFQAEDGIRDVAVTGVQTCALPICPRRDLELLREFVDELCASFPRRWASSETLLERLIDWIALSSAAAVRFCASSMVAFCSYWSARLSWLIKGRMSVLDAPCRCAVWID